MGMRPERCALARRIHGSLGVQWRARSRDSPAIFGAKSEALLYEHSTQGAPQRAQAVSQSVSYFTVPPRAHSSTGSQASNKQNQASKQRKRQVSNFAILMAGALPGPVPLDEVMRTTLRLGPDEVRPDVVSPVGSASARARSYAAPPHASEKISQADMQGPERTRAGSSHAPTDGQRDTQRQG